MHKPLLTFLLITIIGIGVNGTAVAQNSIEKATLDATKGKNILD